MCCMQGLEPGASSWPCRQPPASLHQLAELAASLDHLVQSAIGRLLLAFEAHGLPMAGGINEGLVDVVVVTYWMALGCDTRWTF